MKKAAAIVLVLSFAILTVSASAQMRDKLDENTVYSVLYSADRSLTPDDINVRMIKKLGSRVKVNLDYKGSNAVLYLKWRKVRNLYRWWFERNHEASLVIFSSSYSSARSNSQLADEESAAKAPKKEKKTEQKAEKEKVEKAEAAPKAEEKTSPEKKAAVKETPQPEKEAADEPEAAVVVEKEKEKEKTTETSAEKVAPSPEKPVESTEETAPVDSKPMASANKDKKIPKPVATGDEIDEKVEEPKAEIAPKPVKKLEKPKATVVNRDSQLADSGVSPKPEIAPAERETIEEMKLVESGKPAAELMVKPELATGPEGTARQFIATLLVTLGKGKTAEYPLYLLRADEMNEEIEKDNYQRGRDLWLKQMNAIHTKLKAAGRVEVQKVSFQTPKTDAIERSTISSLERRVVEVEKVYTYVRVTLVVDGKQAVLNIGGLMKTPGGWRIGGRMEYLDDLVLQ